jgi:hypothetical protein
VDLAELLAALVAVVMGAVAAFPVCDGTTPLADAGSSQPNAGLANSGKPSRSGLKSIVVRSAHRAVAGFADENGA